MLTVRRHYVIGQQRTLMLVRPHSKIALREAIKNDSDFLCRSNIMDYSYDLCVFVTSSMRLTLLQASARN
jgi:hypothetical protein